MLGQSRLPNMARYLHILPSVTASRLRNQDILYTRDALFSEIPPRTSQPFVHKASRKRRQMQNVREIPILRVIWCRLVVCLPPRRHDLWTAPLSCHFPCTAMDSHPSLWLHGWAYTVCVLGCGRVANPIKFQFTLFQILTKPCFLIPSNTNSFYIPLKR